jgi:hypothetical protein
MKSVFACCAVLAFACWAPATPASARSAFDGYILRPPASIPHARGTRAAAAPLPRPKPVAAAPAAPSAPVAASAPAAASAGPLVFPPVAPLE